MSQSPHWQAMLGSSKSVTIGQVIYPTYNVRQVYKKICSRWEKGGFWGGTEWSLMLGPHQFLRPRNGSLLSLDDSTSQVREFLLIKLSPKEKWVPQDSSSYKFLEQAPDLEIYLDIDQDRKCIALKEVRLVLKARQTDLMLPHESNDLRFNSEQYAISSAELDPRLSAFIKASNLALWSSDRLKTPSLLFLDVPRKNGKGQDHGLVKYIFNALEHRTQLFVVQDRYRYEFTMIEAGRAGGQREEFRIHVQNPSLENKSTDCQTLFSKAKDWFTDMPLTSGIREPIVSTESVSDEAKALRKYFRKIPHPRQYFPEETPLGPKGPGKSPILG